MNVILTNWCNDKICNRNESRIKTLKLEEKIIRHEISFVVAFLWAVPFESADYDVDSMTVFLLFFSYIHTHTHTTVILLHFRSIINQSNFDMKS